MFTLREIKKRVFLALDKYSANGIVMSPKDSVYADIDAKFPDAVDYIRRKIVITSKKSYSSASVVLKAPVFAAPPLEFEPYDVEVGGCAYIKIPSNASAYNISFEGTAGTSTVMEFFAFFEAPVPFISFTNGVPCLPEGFDVEEHISSGACEHYEGASVTVQMRGGIHDITGFMPKNIGAVHSFLIKISPTADKPFTIFGTAFYSGTFPSEHLIPPKGYASASLPTDIAHITQLSADGGLRVSPAGISFDFINAVITAPVSKAGMYHLEYMSYPEKIDVSTPEDTVLDLDVFACDALVYGTAAVICPTSETALAAKLNTIFDECMSNLHNSEARSAVVKDRMFSGNPRRSGVLWRMP